jgi:ParB family chromosome partitioning protein
MPKASRDALGAHGKTDVYYFDPDDLEIVEDEKSVLYDDRAKDDFNESLVANIMFDPDGDGVAQGVLEPLLLRRNTETGKCQVIAGRKRTKAAREANRRLKKQGRAPIRVPGMIKRSSDTRAISMLISENEHRTEDSPMNRAKKAQRFIDLGNDEKGVAVLLGTSEATVKNLLRLLDAPAAIRNAVDAGKITTSDGYKLSKEEPEKAKKLLAELIEHAPRTSGRKRSKNAKKAREIVSGGAAAASEEPSAKLVKKSENAVAEAIAAWIEATWNENGDWGGAPSEIPARIRSGDWREKGGEKAAE